MRLALRAGAAKTGLRRRRASILDNEAFLGYLLLVPTIGILAVFLAFPFAYGVVLSMTSTEVGDSALGQFVGFAHSSFVIAKDVAVRDACLHTSPVPFLSTV